MNLDELAKSPNAVKGQEAMIVSRVYAAKSANNMAAQHEEVEQELQQARAAIDEAPYLLQLAGWAGGGTGRRGGNDGAARAPGYAALWSEAKTRFPRSLE